jgi:hypothetical protein
VVPAPAAGIPWRWVALGSLVLWVVSVVAWLVWRRRGVRVVSTGKSAEPSVASSSQWRAAFLAAAKGNDAARQAHALLAWARSERSSLQNLGDLSHALASAPQCEAIAALQRQHYAGQRQAGLGDQLAAAFREGFAWRREDDGVSASPLPPLYPFNLHR